MSIPVIGQGKVIDLSARTRIPKPMSGFMVIRAIRRNETPEGLVVESKGGLEMFDDRAFYYVVEACADKYFVNNSVLDSPIKVGMQVLMNPAVAQPVPYLLDVPYAHFVVQIHAVSAFFDSPLEAVSAAPRGLPEGGAVH